MKGQLLIDFLSQPGPQLVGADVQETSHKHTKFAEELGDLSLQWLHQQRELESQVRALATGALLNTSQKPAASKAESSQFTFWSKRRCSS